MARKHLETLLWKVTSSYTYQERSSEFSDHIELHLERLPARHREIMEMRLLDELSYEEISAELEIPVGTVKSRIARARTHLTRSLGLKKDANVHVFAQELVRGRH